MSTYLSLARLAVAALALAVVSSSHAELVTVYGENLTPGNMVSGTPLTVHDSFLSKLTNVRTETFDTKVPTALDQNITSLPIVFKGLAGDKTATITGGGQVAATSNNDAGRFNTTGTAPPPPPTSAPAPVAGQWWDSSATTVTITFDSPISAFGFYGTDFGDFGGQVSVTLTGSGGILQRTITTTRLPTCSTDATACINPDNAALIFWGFYDTKYTYTKIEFGNSNGGTSDTADYFGFDDMVVGDLGQINRAPEPATLMLTGLGLLGLAATRRKQSH